MATNVADATNQSDLKLLLILSGPYIGQNLILDDATAAAATADEWGIDYHDADFDPYNVPFGAGGNTDLPESYSDFLTSLVPVEAPPPGPPDVIEPDPAPTLDELDPATAVVGDPDLTMHVYGAGFTNASVIVFNGGDEPTTFVSATEVTTGVKPSTASAAVAVPVKVRNGTSLSNSLDFTFTEAEPPVE